MGFRLAQKSMTLIDLERPQRVYNHWYLLGRNGRLMSVLLTNFTDQIAYYIFCSNRHLWTWRRKADNFRM